MLQGKKILLGITGSIAAYKAAALVRLLKKAGAEVQVLLTPAARDFIGPVTLSTLSGKPVYSDGFNPETGEWYNHVALGRWADAMVIAPATASTLGKMASGIADNFLVTTYLAAKCPVFFAPAMDLDMFFHPSTQKSIKTLVAYGNHLIAPQEGELASGLCGAGRMEEPEMILQVLNQFFLNSQKFLGKKVLVTAGPTYEKIDDVRFLGNFSTGLMGFEIARCFASQGAEVILITGPSSLSVSEEKISRIDVVSANDMYKACERHFPETDITVMAAAVADYMPENKVVGKIKKEKKENLLLNLIPTVDILASLGKFKKKSQILAGFALETSDEKKNAHKKLDNKNLDLIVLNSLNDEGAGFGTPSNKITIIDRLGNEKEFDLKSKREVAEDIVAFIYKTMYPSPS